MTMSHHSTGLLPAPAGDTFLSGPPPGDARGIVTAAVAILEQGEELLRVLPRTVYTSRLPMAFNASIGGHYRHCLDHFISVLRGWETDIVDYDDRERDGRVEGDPEFALELTGRIRAEVERLPEDALGVAVQARAEVSYAPGAAPVTGSTLGREIVYAIAHAVHHYALIAVMARLLGATLPGKFGVAPSTAAHLARGVK